MMLANNYRIIVGSLVLIASAGIFLLGAFGQEELDFWKGSLLVGVKNNEENELVYLRDQYFKQYCEDVRNRVHLHLNTSTVFSVLFDHTFGSGATLANVLHIATEGKPEYIDEIMKSFSIIATGNRFMSPQTAGTFKYLTKFVKMTEEYWLENYELLYKGCNMAESISNHISHWLSELAMNHPTGKGVNRAPLTLDNVGCISSRRMHILANVICKVAKNVMPTRRF